MNKQNVVRDLKVVSFEIIYSQVKEILKGVSSDSEVFDKLQKTIDSVDNLLSTIEEEQSDVVVKTIESENEKDLVEEQPIFNDKENVTEDTAASSDDSKDNEVDSVTSVDDEDVSVNEEVYQVEEPTIDVNSIDTESSSEEVVSEQNGDEAPAQDEEINVDINYNLEKYTRLTNNPVKAIIVNINQLRKLRESLHQQRQLLDFGVVAVVSDENNDVVSTVSIENLLEQASKLYKEGKIEESEKLYEQIRNMNKSV